MSGKEDEDDDEEGDAQCKTLHFSLDYLPLLNKGARIGYIQNVDQMILVVVDPFLSPTAKIPLNIKDMAPSADDVQIPPEPPGRCSKLLQVCITTDVL